MEAILIVGHGSRDFEGNEEIRQFVDRIQPELNVSIVETCFLEFEHPTIMQGLETCVNKGAKKVIVIPMMLFSAGHSKIHIPAAIDEARQIYPDVQFTYGRPIGIHDHVLEIMMSRIQDYGLQAIEEDKAILVLGRGSSDPDANSDLCKMSRLLWERLNVKWVETAFMGVTNPLMDEGIERCIRLGARHVLVVPYFLFTGILIKRMEDMVETYRHQYPDHTFGMAEYFGFHPLLLEIIKERIQEALEGEVSMNCDTCHYRLEAAKHMHHHHHHDHDHGHGGGHDHHHNHSHGHQQEQVHSRGHDHHRGHDHNHNHDHGHDHDHDHQGITK